MTYEGTTTTTMEGDGPPPTTFEGTWRFTGGTGKFKNLSGSGTCKGMVTEEGLSYAWEGEYGLE